MSNATSPQAFEYISYCDFGAAFFERAVTIDRIAANFGGLSGQESTIGPIAADPLGVVRVTAQTRTGEPRIERAAGDFLTFAIALPIDLELDVTVDAAPKKVVTLGGLLPDLGIVGGLIDPTKKLSYRGTVTVNLTLTARPAKPLLIVVDIAPPTPRTVDVDIKADGRIATLLQQGGVLEGEIKKAVSKQVSKQLTDPKLQQGLVLDVADRVDKMR